MKHRSLKRFLGSRKRIKRKGFTLLELLAVLTILAIVVGIAGPAIFRQITKGKANAARAQIASLGKSLNTFYLDCGFFPQSPAPGLDALISPPSAGRQCKEYDPEGYLENKKLPEDPWHNPYVYVSPGQHHPSSFDLSSDGPDGQPGTKDDITNWE